MNYYLSCALLLATLCFASALSFPNYRENRDLQNLHDQFGFDQKISSSFMNKLDALKKTTEKLQKEEGKRQTNTCTDTKTGISTCSGIVKYSIPSSMNALSADTAVTNSLQTYTSDKYNQSCLDALKCIACTEAFPSCTSSAYKFPCKTVCQYYYQSCGYSGATVACDTFPETNCIELSSCPGASLNSSSGLQVQWILLIGILAIIIL